jgi:hypothetical protein
MGTLIEHSLRVDVGAGPRTETLVATEYPTCGLVIPCERGQRTRRATASSPVARSVQIREDTDAFTSAPDRPGGSLGTGLFSAYVDESDQPGVEAGPASVPVDDAIAWGRASASTVVVLVCDDAGGGAYFSAGEVAPTPDAMGALLRWPDEGGLLAARRLACHATSGLPAQDIEAPDGSWDVELDVFGSAPIDLADFVSRWVEAVSSYDSGRSWAISVVAS